MQSISTLPAELILAILEYLDKRSLLELGRTSHQFNSLCVTHVQRHAVKQMLALDGARPYLHRTVLLQLSGVTETLLAMGAPCEKTDAAGETALHAAARNNYLPSLQSLLRCGACVDARSTHGWTPLLLAARYGHIAVAGELIGAGANVDMRGFHGWTALHLARRYAHRGLCELLLTAGANASAVDDDGCLVGQKTKCWGVI